MPLVKTRELLHVEIPVNDLARAEDFYTNILGMEVSGRNSNNLRLRCENGEREKFDPIVTPLSAVQSRVLHSQSHPKAPRHDRYPDTNEQ